MTREVVYLPEVSRDYFGAQRYYETISPGTGERFQAAFKKAEHEIEAGLITHHVDFTHYHRVNLHRFPYAMFYRLHESRIVVVALLPIRRDPKSIHQELANR